MRKILIVLIGVIFFSSCASTKFTESPDFANLNYDENLAFSGEIDFKGNKKYLPRNLVNDSNSSTKIKYRYHVKQHEDTTNQLVSLFNPLTLIGFPIKKEVIIYSGELVIDETTEKRFFAEVKVTQKGTLYDQGDSLTELRRKYLTIIRDNIEKQVSHDLSFK